MNKIELKEKYNFPGKVHDYTIKIMDSLDKENFFEMEEINTEIFYKNLASVGLSHYLNDGLPITEEDMLGVIANSAAESVLESLRERGLLDSFPDESGEEHYFLTSDGKAVADLILEDEAYKKSLDESNDSDTSKTV